MAVQMRIFMLSAAIIALTFVTGGGALAGTKVLKCTASGTSVDIPIDNDSDSCFTVENGALVCTDTSAYGNLSGKCSPGGQFTWSYILELDPVSGPGCNIGGATAPGIASCKLAGTSEQGCELELAGGAGVRRDTSSGDLLFLTSSAITLCIDLSNGPPFNFTASYDETITGGTGKNAGASGTGTGTSHGQALTSDPAGHGLSWTETSFTDTITTKEQQ